MQGAQVGRPARGGRLRIRLRLERIAAQRHRRRRRQWRICVRQPGCTGGNGKKKKKLEHHQFSAENAGKRKKKGGVQGQPHQVGGGGGQRGGTDAFGCGGWSLGLGPNGPRSCKRGTRSPSRSRARSEETTHLCVMMSGLGWPALDFLPKGAGRGSRRQRGRGGSGLRFGSPTLRNSFGICSPILGNTRPSLLPCGEPAGSSKRRNLPTTHLQGFAKMEVRTNPEGCTAVRFWETPIRRIAQKWTYVGLQK